MKTEEKIKEIIENITEKFELNELKEPTIGLKMERRQLSNSSKYIRIPISIGDSDGIIYGSDWGEYSLHVYKYKDDIFPFHEEAKGKTITFIIQMDDEPGILSNVLRAIAENHGNILTIHQSIPISGIATLTLSVQILQGEGDAEAMVDDIEQMEGIHYLKILGRE